MPKRNYQPTEQDRVTGRRVRELRNRRGETLKQTVEAAGFGKDASTLAAVERGERRLTEIEATRLAAHFGTTADQLLNYAEPVTEQEWLGNDKPALFAVPDAAQSGDVIGPDPRTMLIDLDHPLSPSEYREQVWIPYLENRYATELRQTG